MVVSIALWKTATGSETSCGWSRQCFMSSYTELVQRELDILKQELRRTCAVDRPHISIKRFAISQQVGHDIVNVRCTFSRHTDTSQKRHTYTSYATGLKLACKPSGLFANEYASIFFMRFAADTPKCESNTKFTSEK